MEIPDWVVTEGRSLSMPARVLLWELFAQGERVVSAKASGSVEFVRWGESLAALRGCPSSSSVKRATEELVARGFLVEQPGARFVNNRPRSAWLVPVALDVVEHASISKHAILDHARGHASISKYAPGSPDSAPSVEHTSITKDATGAHFEIEVCPSYIGTHPGAQYSSSSSSGVAASSSPSMVRSESGPVEGESGADPRQYGVGRAVVLAGLRAARVRRPEDVLRQYPLNSLLGALREWVEGQAAHQADPSAHPAIKSPSGFVLAKARLEYEPVVDFGFAGWWA